MEDKITLNIAVLTISDTRTQETDKSGNLLVKLIQDTGHQVVEHLITKDNIYSIRRIISKWIDTKSINVVITTGGTGVTGRDGTPEAVEVLLDKKIRTSTVQSRALAGVANSTYIFCLPGSPGACKDAWADIIQHQLDSNNKPCNLVELIPRLKD